MTVALYKLRNLPHMMRSWLVLLGCYVAVKMGGIAAYGTVKIKLIRADGTTYNFGTVGHRVVTTAGVTFMATGFKDGTKDISTLKYHASGTGVVAENITDVALGTEVTDNARTAGTNTNPSANQYQTVNTITYTGAHAITEHGIFNQIVVAASILWDRTVFAAINVAVADSIQFTYVLTINAGG